MRGQLNLFTLQMKNDHAQTAPQTTPEATGKAWAMPQTPAEQQPSDLPESLKASFSGRLLLHVP
ncbi:MAG: hypothetical protein HPY61_06215 [Methanotrichaceae archaeon]|nr:hypothetical protein [Methanotrichaceae archaeon]